MSLCCYFLATFSYVEVLCDFPVISLTIFFTRMHSKSNSLIHKIYLTECVLNYFSLLHAKRVYTTRNPFFINQIAVNIKFHFADILCNLLIFALLPLFNTHKCLAYCYMPTFGKEKMAYQYYKNCTI